MPRNLAEGHAAQQSVSRGCPEELGVSDWDTAAAASRRGLGCLLKRGSARRHCGRQRHVPPAHHRAQAVRVVGDDPVDAECNETGHFSGLIYGPGDHLQSERSGLRQIVRSQVAEVRRPYRAACSNHEPGCGAVEIVDVEPRGPWRCTGATTREVITAAALDRQADACDLRGDATRDRERAPIERLNGDAISQPRRAYLLGDGGGKGLGVRRWRAGGRRQLGLDVETDMISPGSGERDRTPLPGSGCGRRRPLPARRTSLHRMFPA